MSWSATLDLRFGHDSQRTALVRRRHSGPLQVQKALYPEGPAVCHVAVLHPPGGIVGGDTLEIAIQAEPGAHAVLTTPGATRWYRTAAARASQRLVVRLDDGATVEWLPRENILFRGSAAAMALDVDLAEGARYLGWEILCFGRTASAERWDRGSLAMDSRVRIDGRLAWAEQARIDAQDGFAASPVGLAGHPVSATLLAAGIAVQPPLLQACRESASGADPAQRGVTVLPGVMVARYLGASAEDAFEWFAQLRSLLRPAWLGCAGVRPRLWAC